MYAEGSFIQPIYLRVSRLLSRGSEAGSSYECLKKEWITTELFFKRMVHFAEVIKPTTLDPVLLIFDNHTSHIAFEI